MRQDALFKDLVAALLDNLSDVLQEDVHLTVSRLHNLLWPVV